MLDEKILLFDEGLPQSGTQIGLYGRLEGPLTR